MPELRLEDTIAALSTPPGEGGIAVIRMSGKEALSLVAHLFRPSKRINLAEQPTHTIHHGHFLDEKGNLLDEVLISIFHSPHSYTGEEVVEISCHGGIRLTHQILELLFRKGARPAEPGEFTKRAFLNGKMDLTQAEAVLDLIQSRSQASLEAALQQLQGKLSEKINSLKETLLKIQAHWEASLDFPDEHLEIDSEEECLGLLRGVQEKIRDLVASFRRGRLLREGILTVIVGRPNVGKSSLLNAFLEKDRALVSPIPGTTRDALEETIEIEGFGIRLVDTAGLTSPKHELDQMGMDRTRRYLNESELVLFLIDGSEEWRAEDEAIFSELKGKNILPVVNKVDLSQKLDLDRLICLFPETPLNFISCATGTGLRELERQIAKIILEKGFARESVTLTRLRHKQALEEALAALQQSERLFREKVPAEIVLVELKGAVDSLRELIGEVYSEDLLDVIFQEFCIGK